MGSRYSASAFAVIMAVILPVLGVIMIVQGGISNIELVFAINLILGGISVFYLLYYCIYKDQELDVTILFWFNIISIFQTWFLIPIYIYSSEKIRRVIKNICKIILIIYVAIVIYFMIVNR